MAWVWDHSQSRKSERLVLLAIADCASDDGANAYPSTATLCRKTGLSERAVQRAVAALEALGELRVERNGGPRGCNRFTVTMTPGAVTPPSTRRGVNAPGGTDDTPVKDDANPRQTDAQNHQEPSKISSSKRSTSEPDRPDVEQLCRHLAARIVGNGSRQPTITQKWRDEARRLLDRDGRTVDQVMTTIDWCQDSLFWRGNVLSMPKLREKYDALRLAAERERKEERERQHHRHRPANRHIDPLTPQQRAARDPFAGAVRASEEIP